MAALDLFISSTSLSHSCINSRRTECVGHCFMLGCEILMKRPIIRHYSGGAQGPGNRNTHCASGPSSPFLAEASILS